jgi:cytochrome b6-f complex iron-sulfur subunit
MPSKVPGVPNETKQSTVEQVDNTRRTLLGAMFGSFFGLGMTALGAAGALWTLATGRFMLPNLLTQPPNRFKVGFPDQYPPGHVETRFKDEYAVWIVHGTYRGKRQIYALRTVCTHLGCIVIWQEAEEKFKCPCHGSGFFKDGINFEGPAPRPLERYAIRIADDGQLEVDKSRMFQEELGQWSDPASFVSV